MGSFLRKGMREDNRKSSPSNLKQNRMIEFEKRQQELDNGISNFKLPVLTFSWDDIKQISDENFGDLNRCIDYEQFDKDKKFRPSMFMVHHFGYLSPRTSHLRVCFPPFVLQDMTVEQYFKYGKLEVNETKKNGEVNISMMRCSSDIGVDIPLKDFKKGLKEKGLEYQPTEDLIKLSDLWTQRVCQINGLIKK
jgi:hypothetical protein